MPKKNVDLELKDLSGNVILNDDKKSNTVKNIFTSALIAPSLNDDVTGDVKFSRYQLATKISKGGDIDFTPEEIVMLKLLVGKGFPPLVVGQVYELLNE